MNHQILQLTAFFAVIAQHFGTELLRTQEQLIATQRQLMDLQEKMIHEQIEKTVDQAAAVLRRHIVQKRGAA